MNKEILIIHGIMTLNKIPVNDFLHQVVAFGPQIHQKKSTALFHEGG